LFFTEDPYYWGLRARIPNFVKSRSKSKSKSGAPEPPQQPLMKSKSAGSALGAGRQEESPYSLPPHPFWWHNRMYQQSNNDPGQMSESAFLVLIFFIEPGPVILNLRYTYLWGYVRSLRGNRKYIMLLVTFNLGVHKHQKFENRWSIRWWELYLPFKVSI